MEKLDSSACVKEHKVQHLYFYILLYRYIQQEHHEQHITLIKVSLFLFSFIFEVRMAAIFTRSVPFLSVFGLIGWLIGSFATGQNR